MVNDWRKPYRSMDAGGSPDSATSVALQWIDDEGLVLQRFYGACSIEMTSNSEGLTVIALYLGTELRACATIFRDPMNFAVLVRWKA